MPILMKDGSMLNLADKESEALHAAQVDGVFVTEQQAVAMIMESQAHRDALDVESVWKESEVQEIARQLEALEEAEADVRPADLLPGTRKQWLKYRGQVSNWCTSSPGFPDSEQRPVRPS